jgi:hypothetical protein
MLVPFDGGFVGCCEDCPVCDSVVCISPFETCDPNTGNCLCGPITDSGTLPPQCASGFFCGSFDGGAPPQCFQPCDPYGANCPTLSVSPDAGAPDGGSIVQSCYYEAWMNALVCEPVLNPIGYEGLPCSENDACPVIPTYGALACLPLTADEVSSGFTRACRFYCDTFDGGGDHRCPDIPHCLQCGDPIRKCVPLAIVDAGGTPIAVGACQPVQ